MRVRACVRACVRAGVLAGVRAFLYVSSSCGADPICLIKKINGFSIIVVVNGVPPP